ncbi:hypothetical protein T492DRAFT_1104647, partial [Pavlovales sp. CCMP2436]
TRGASPARAAISSSRTNYRSWACSCPSARPTRRYAGGSSRLRRARSSAARPASTPTRSPPRPRSGRCCWRPRARASCCTACRSCTRRRASRRAASRPAARCSSTAPCKSAVAATRACSRAAARSCRAACATRLSRRPTTITTSRGRRRRPGSAPAGRAATCRSISVRTALSRT